MRLQTRVFWSAAILMCLLCFAVVSSVLARVATAMVQPQGLSLALDVPEKLAEAHVQTMAANATHVFWTVAVTGEFCPAGGEPAIRRVPLAGGAVETLYHSCTFNPYQLAADATHVYFADWSDNKIKRIPVSGGSPSVVASGSSLILYRGLALDDTHVYWGDANGICRAPKAGGAVETLAAGVPSLKLAVDSTHVYWTVRIPGQVQRVAKTGGTVQTLASGLNEPWGIALDATQVYFTELGTGKAYRMGKDGSGLAAYFADSISPYMAEEIAVNNTMVCWTDTTSLHDGRVRRVPKAGGTVENLALGLFGPASIHLTDTHVYWGDSNGVWRLPVSAAEVKVDLSITGIEVTQGIQCLDNTTGDTTCADNSVPLIADKPTYVRVYPAVTVADTPNVTARLTGTHGGTPLPGSPISPVNPTAYVRVSGGHREHAVDSFNFLLPPNWRNGTIRLRAEINPATPIPESNTGNNLSVEVTITFQSPRTLRIAYVPISYTWSGWTGPTVPSLFTMLEAQDYLRSLFPVSQLVYYGWPAQPFSKPITVSVNQDELLTKLNQRYLTSTDMPAPDQVFGWLPKGSWDNGKSDPKWDNGLGVVSAGDPVLAPVVIAHEIGHNLGRRHPTCYDSASDWPYGTNVTTTLEVGFDVYSLKALPGTVPDWMVGGNCGNDSNLNLWISPWNWRQMINQVTDWSPPASGPESAGQQQPVAVVSGRLTLQGGQLSPLWLLDEPLSPTPPGEGSTYCVSFLDQAGSVLLQRCFDADLRYRSWQGLTDSGVFAMRLPFPLNTSRIRLSRGADTLDERRVSAHTPVVQVISPNGGEAWNATHTVRWSASDADGDPLSYNVLYSPDGGATWQSLASDVTETGLEVDSSQLAGSRNAFIRVLATDGVLTGKDQSDQPFTVARHPPMVHILGPDKDASYGLGELIMLTGSAYDLEDGALSGESLRWRVEGIGEVGTGGEASLRISTWGEYTVTLRASDSDEMVGQESVRVFVGPTVHLLPGFSTVGVSELITVNIQLEAMQNLYGAQVEIAFDPQLLQVIDAYPTVPGVQIRDGDFWVPDVALFNQVDNAAGSIQYAVSLRGEKPGVSGSGTLASIVFRSQRPGVCPVRLTRIILSDPQSVRISAHAEDAVVVVQQATGTADGWVRLERRGSNAGATVCVGSLCATTAADGRYTIPNILPGSYTVIVSRPSYLRSQRAISVPVGLLTLPTVTLLGGDVNQDARIELADGALIGQAWNSMPGSPNWDERCDITDDDRVNILDMVAVQFNWNQRAPGPWAGAATPGKAVPAEAAPAAEGQALGTQVVISPSLTTLASLGDTASVHIQVQDVSRLYAVWVQLSFDPRVLRVRDADPRPSAPGVQITPGDFLDPINQQVLVNSVDNTAGTIDFAVTQTYPATARGGSGVLASIEFEAVGGGSSAVHISSVRLLDDSKPDPVEIPAGTHDGQVLGPPNRLYLPIVLK